jgi:hypothetical protein
MFYLVSKLDPNNHAKVRKEPFETEQQAIDRARALRASGEAFAFVFEDDQGAVADDAEMLKLIEGGERVPYFLDQNPAQPEDRRTVAGRGKAFVGPRSDSGF